MSMDAIVWLLIAWAFLLILLQSRRNSQIDKRLAKLSRIEVKLDLLLKHAGVVFDPYKDVPEEIADALRNGRKIDAIAHHQKLTGVGLAEAKEFIETIQRRSGQTV